MDEPGTPLERAAKAIRENLPCNSGEDPPDVEQLIPVARAVLASIREPSEALAAQIDQTFYPSGANAETIWRAMIDAALAEGE